MLDHYTFRTGSSFTRVETEIHEHRAPTDASVKLLTEMEEAALSKILSVNRLKNNELEADWTVIDSPVAFELKGRCRYKLNGKEHTFVIELDRNARSNDHARQIVQKLIENIAVQIATALLNQTHYQSLVINPIRRALT